MAPRPSLLRARDLEQTGLSRVAIRRMVGRGELIEVSRGLYARADHESSEHLALAVVAARVPRAVICLLSALAFHELTTQAPNEVWIALPPRTWRPQLDWPPTHVVRFSGARLDEGIERHTIEGVKVAVFSPAKTVIDCFRYRNSVGLDVALEALRELLRAKLATKAQLSELAARQGASTPLRPYLESV